MNIYIITFISIIQTFISLAIIVEFYFLISELIKKPNPKIKTDNEDPSSEPNDPSPNPVEEPKIKANIEKYCSLVYEFESLTEKLKKALKDITRPDAGYFHPLDIDFDISKYKVIVEKLKSMEENLKKDSLSIESFEKFKKCFFRRINAYLSIGKTYREGLGI